MMRLSERRLRVLIRSILLEQVVGYQAPSKSYDDPLGDDDQSSKSGSDDGGYLSVGEMGVDIPLHGSEDEQQVSGMQVKKLTQQRQQALNKGDTTGAESAGEQLALARKLRR